MGNSGPLPRVGVRLIADDSAAFLRTLRNAENQIQALGRAAQRPINLNFDQSRRNVSGFSLDLQRAEAAVQRFGQTAGQSITLTPRVDTSQLESAGNNAGSNFNNGFQNSLNPLQTIAQGFFLGIGNIAANAMMAGLGNLKDRIGAAIGDSIDFQQNVANVSSLTGIDPGDTAALANIQQQIGDTIQAVATSPNLVVGIESASQASLALLKTGQDVADINSTLLEQTILFQNATATNIQSTTEMGLAAEVVGRGLSLFGLGVEDTARFVNAATATITGSAIRDLQDYRYALVSSASAIQQLQLPVEDFNALIISTSKSFSSGRTAGTALEQFLIRLANPTDDAAAALKELGIQAFDAQGNFVGLARIQQQLAAAFERGFTPEEQLQLLNRAFGTVGSEMATALGRTEEFAAGMERAATTSTQAIADIKTDTIKTTWGNLLDISDALGIKLAAPFTDSLQPAIVAGQKALSAFSDEAEQLGQAIATLATPAINSLATALNALALFGGTTDLSAISNVIDAQIGATQSDWQAILDNPSLALNALGDLTFGSNTFEQQQQNAIAGFQSLQTLIGAASDEAAQGVVGIDNYIARISEIASESVRSGAVSQANLQEIKQLYATITTEIERNKKAAEEAAAAQAANAPREALTGQLDEIYRNALSELEARAINLTPQLGVEGATQQFDNLRGQLDTAFDALEEDLAGRQIFDPSIVAIEAGDVVNGITEQFITEVAQPLEANPIPIDIPIDLASSLSNFGGLDTDVAGLFSAQTDGLLKLNEAFIQTGALAEEQQAQLAATAALSELLTTDQYGLATAIDTVSGSQALTTQGADLLLQQISLLQSGYNAGQIGAEQYAGQLGALVQALIATAQAAGIADSTIASMFGGLQTAVANARAAVGSTQSAQAGLQFGAAAGNARAQEALFTAQNRAAEAQLDAAKKGAKVQQKAAKNIESTLNSIDGLFKHSQVTAEDMAAADAGRYQDKADEFLRRLKAFSEGATEWGETADQARQALEKVGVTPADDPKQLYAQTVEAWDSGLLFYAEENVALINRAAVEAQAEMQRKAEIGKQNVIAAFGGLIDGMVAGTSAGLGGGAGGEIVAPVPDFVPVTQEAIAAAVPVAEIAQGAADTLAAQNQEAITAAFAGAGTIETGGMAQDLMTLGQEAIKRLFEGAKSIETGGMAQVQPEPYELDVSKLVSVIGELPEAVIVDKAALVETLNALPDAVTLDKSTLVDIFGDLPAKVELDKGALVSIIGDLPATVTVDKSTLVSITGELPAAITLDKGALVDIIGDLPATITLDKSSLVDIIGDLPEAVTLDKAQLVSVINALPDAVAVDLAKLVGFTGEVPAGVTIDKAALVAYINELPGPVTIDRSALLNVIGTLPDAVTLDKSLLVQLTGDLPAAITIDKSTLIDIINELPEGVTLDKSSLVAITGELPEGVTLDKAALVDIIGDLPDTVTVDKSALVAIAGELPAKVEIDKSTLVDIANELPPPVVVDQSALVQVTGSLPDPITIDLSKMVTVEGLPAVAGGGAAGYSSSEPGNAGGGGRRGFYGPGGPVEVVVLNPQQGPQANPLATGETLPVVIQNPEAFLAASQGIVTTDNGQAGALGEFIDPKLLEDWGKNADAMIETELRLNNAKATEADAIAGQNAALATNTQHNTTLGITTQNLNTVMGTAGAGISTTGSDVIKVFGSITDEGDPLAESLSLVTEESRGVEGSFNTLSSNMDTFGTKLGDSVAGLEALPNAIDTFASTIENAIKKIDGASSGGGNQADPGTQVTDPTPSGAASLLGGEAYGPTLTGEGGRELWYNPYTHESGIVGVGGAEIVNFAPGTRVVSNPETEKILARSGGAAALFGSAAFGSGLFGNGGLGGGISQSNSSADNDPVASTNNDALLSAFADLLASQNSESAATIQNHQSALSSALRAANASSGDDVADAVAKAFRKPLGGRYAAPSTQVVYINVDNKQDNRVTTNNYNVAYSTMRSSESWQNDIRRLEALAR